jgi:hypothetical protein
LGKKLPPHLKFPKGELSWSITRSTSFTGFGRLQNRFDGYAPPPLPAHFISTVTFLTFAFEYERRC